jgi:hypothetical protein
MAAELDERQHWVGSLYRHKWSAVDGLYSREHRWTLLGSKGAVHFVANERTPTEEIPLGVTGIRSRDPLGASWIGLDVGYHSPKECAGARLEGECDILDGPCWRDSSGLLGIELCRKWAEAAFGDETIWNCLVNYYIWVFYSRERCEDVAFEVSPFAFHARRGDADLSPLPF